MICAHKITRCPTLRWVADLSHTAGYARVLYNYVLADFKAGLNDGIWRSHHDLRKRFNATPDERFPWHRDLSQTTPQSPLQALDEELKHWRRDTRRWRFPKFRKRDSKVSFRADNGPERGRWVRRGRFDHHVVHRR